MPNFQGVDTTGKVRDVLLDDTVVDPHDPAPLVVSGTVTVDTSALATAAKQDTGNTSLASILAAQSSGAQKTQIVNGSNQTNDVTHPLYVAPSTGATTTLGAGSATIGAVTAPGAAALALDATLTGGTAKAIVRGGTKGATVTAADITSTANGADHQGGDVVEQYAPVAEDNANGVIAIVQKPIAANTYAPSLATDFGVATKANVKNAAGNVLGVVGTNANGSARWFQLHNKATAPVATEVPLYSFWVAAGGNIVIGSEFFIGSGGAFSTGIGWAWSTTAGTFTDSATASDHTTTIHYK